MKQTWIDKALVICLLFNAISVWAADPRGPKLRQPKSTESTTESKEKESEPARPKIEKRVERLESSVSKIEAEIEEVRSRYSINYLNRPYVKGGLSIILPRDQTFDFRTDTGLGAFFGMGQYFGKNHAAEFSLEWDIYPSLSLHYHFDFHYTKPHISWGPILGYKIKIAPLRPFDNFLADPDAVKTAFPFVGLSFGIPVNEALFTFSMLYLFNSQAFIISNLGLQFLL